jgi:hypothetical protein
MKASRLSSFGLPAAALVLAALPSIAEFRAAAVKVDITPDKPQWLLGYAARQSTGIHDRIHHRIVAMDDGETQFFLVSSEICLVSPAEYDRVAAELEKKTGIQPAQFWWTVTHTHSAPEVGPPGLAAAFLGERYTHAVDPAYTEMAERSLIEGIVEARSRLAPARLGLGWGYSMANINRRARDVEGETYLGLNPDGPADRRIGLLRLDKQDGKPLALIANYAMHGTVLGQQNTLISGDAQGIVAEYVEQKTGAPMLYINGAAGNLAPVYTVQPDPRSGRLRQFRTLLGERILEASRAIMSTTAEVKLATGAITVETPMKKGLTPPAELKEYFPAASGGAGIVRLPVRFLRINNDIAIWAAPLELFCEIAMAVRERSPFPHTLYFGYANGWLGYLLTAAELPLGGYEPRVSPYTAQAEDDLIRGVVGYLHGWRR